MKKPKFRNDGLSNKSGAGDKAQCERHVRAVTVTQAGSIAGNRQVTLHRQQDGTYLSTNLLIVADADDRDGTALTLLGAAPDINQRMFQTALDDTLTVSYSHGGGTLTSTATVGVDVKTLEVDVAVMRVNGKACAGWPQIETDIRETSECLAPANIRVVFNLAPSMYFDPPPSIAANPANWATCAWHSTGAHQMTQETRDVIEGSILDLGNDRLRVIYVPKGVKDADGFGIAGISFASWAFPLDTDTNYLDTCFVTADVNEHYVSPHEVTHLLGVGHEFASWNLMEPWMIFRNGISGTKRLTQEQVNKMRNTGFERNKLK